MERKYRDTAGAAERLSLSPKYLKKLRVEGGGPRFVKAGKRVIYEDRDLDAWAESKKVGSTSEATTRNAEVSA
jgi:hypothetical protein